MCLPSALSVPGKSNDMADVTSRSFRAESGTVMSDNELLAHFDAHFPLPQSRSWKIVTLDPAHISIVVSTLRGKRLTMAQWMSHDESGSGSTGVVSLPAGDCPPSSTGARQASGSTSSARLLTGSGKATLDAATESLRSQWTAQSAPLARPSSWLDSKTPRKSLAAANALYNSAASSKPIAGKIPPRDPS